MRGRKPLHCDVPDALRRQRKAVGFGYGKLDFAIHEGEPILLDANHTPNEGSGPSTDRVAAIRAAIGAELGSFLRRI